MSSKGNAIVIHGGGLVDPSKFVLMRLAKCLLEKHIYDKVFIGKYSFEALYNPNFWLEYSDSLEEALKDKRGTFFGTCREIDLTRNFRAERAIARLIERNITTVIVAGGDGSSRQVAEINDIFAKNGINIIFAIPLTIDGINGGYSIGIEQAVRESIRQIENIVSTSLETRDDEKFGVVMVELQGRNRDDIIANVLSNLCNQNKVADCMLNDLLIRVIPANLKTDIQELIKQINGSTKRTLVLVSEGAEVKIPELTKEIKRKVRSLVVGHPSQSNGMTTKEDERIYQAIMNTVTSVIYRNPYESYCIMYDGNFCYKKDIDYYAKLNPREGQKAKLTKELEDLLYKYMA